MEQNESIFGQTSPPEPDETSPKPNKFICKYEDCFKVFKAKKSLVDHSRIHKGEKPYKCSFKPCDKAFTQFSSLQKHERIHKGEKPYTCTTCGQAFTQTLRSKISNLKRHERSHRGERPHLCDVCSKGFTTSSNLKQHLQTHLQKKEIRDKYQCDSCGKTYNYNSSLKKHLQEHGIDQTKKESKDKVDVSSFEQDRLRNREFIPNPVSYPEYNPIQEPMIQNRERTTWNNYYEFSFPTLPQQNELDIFQGLQRNFLFPGFIPGPIFHRPPAENLGIKRSFDFEKPAVDKSCGKGGKRPYKYHTHVHSLACEHLMIIHQGHVDYLHDGKLHHVVNNGYLEEHELEISEQNPTTCRPVNDEVPAPLQINPMNSGLARPNVTLSMPNIKNRNDTVLANMSNRNYNFVKDFAPVFPHSNRKDIRISKVNVKRIL